MDDVPFGVVNTDAARATGWHYGSVTVCLEEGTSATLESLTPIKTVGDVDIIRAGARQDDGADWVASMPGKLPARYSPITGSRSRADATKGSRSRSPSSCLRLSQSRGRAACWVSVSSTAWHGPDALGERRAA